MTKSQPKHWLALSVATVPESRDAVSAVLFAAGALGCEEREHRLIGYFEDQAPEPLRRFVLAGLERLRQAGLPVADHSPDLVRFPEEDWQANWRQFFKPVRIAGKLIVRPPWEVAEVPPGGVDVVIEPKQAFGTGTHETTRLVLEAIVERSESLPGRALDVGTGSGVLAIAHALFQPRSRVFACDIDAVALDNARENAEANGVAGRCYFQLGSVEQFAGERFPLVYANLQRHIFLPLLQSLVQVLQPGGGLLMSGILAKEETKMRRALEPFPVAIRRKKQIGEWILLTVEKYANCSD